MQLFVFALFKLKHLAVDRCSSKFIQRHRVFLQNLSKTSQNKLLLHVQKKMQSNI